MSWTREAYFKVIPLLEEFFGMKMQSCQYQDPHPEYKRLHKNLSHYIYGVGDYVKYIFNNHEVKQVDVEFLGSLNFIEYLREYHQDMSTKNFNKTTIRNRTLQQTEFFQWIMSNNQHNSNLCANLNLAIQMINTNRENNNHIKDEMIMQEILQEEEDSHKKVIDEKDDVDYDEDGDDVGANDSEFDSEEEEKKPKIVTRSKNNLLVQDDKKRLRNGSSAKIITTNQKTNQRDTRKSSKQNNLSIFALDYTPVKKEKKPTIQRKKEIIPQDGGEDDYSVDKQDTPKRIKPNPNPKSSPRRIDPNPKINQLKEMIEMQNSKIETLEKRLDELLKVIPKPQTQPINNVRYAPPNINNNPHVPPNNINNPLHAPPNMNMNMNVPNNMNYYPNPNPMQYNMYPQQPYGNQY